MNRYIVPKMEYWTANELDSIEARMSGGGGSVAGFCYIDGSYINTSYDGEKLTIEYKVKNKPPQVGNGIELIVGVEYALSALEGKQVFIPLNTEPGTYEEVFEVPNYMCAFRGYVQERIGIQGMGAVTNKNPGETYYPYSTEKNVYFITKNKIDEYTEKFGQLVLWSVGMTALSLYIPEIIVMESCVGKIVVSICEGVVNEVVLKVVINSFNLPETEEEQYWKFIQWYEKSKFYTQLTIWDSKECYDKEVTPVYDEKSSCNLPDFPF